LAVSLFGWENSSAKAGWRQEGPSLLGQMGIKASDSVKISVHIVKGWHTWKMKANALQGMNTRVFDKMRLSYYDICDTQSDLFIVYQETAHRKN
jgi:hypothetical protein